MLELLSPAGCTEAVIAAVQSGADTIYIGRGASAPAGDGAELSPEELAKCLRYCRIRNCRAAVCINELVADDTMQAAVDRAVFAARHGADALVVRDVGLIGLLRRVLPDMPLWGDVRMDIHSVAGAMAAASLGLSRLMLAPELTPEQAGEIARSIPAETAYCVHGPACAARSGQCYLSAMDEAHGSDSALHCGEPCRGRFSLGGRMDDTPLSEADLYRIDHLAALEEAGIPCVYINGRGRRPEYIAYVTGLYSRAIREHVPPTQDEYDRLRELFAPHGIADDLASADPEKAPPPEKLTGRALERACADIRRGYMEGELRRVPVTFYAVIRQGRPAMFAAEDSRGHRAVYEGYAPIDLGRQGITPERVQDILYRTGGTPYDCVGVKCAIDPHMDYADEALEQARRALLTQITDQNREAPLPRIGELPEPPLTTVRRNDPKLILQLSRAEQLTPELAEAAPDLLYLPAEVLAAGVDALEDFRGQGVGIAAVLPRAVSDDEMPVLRELLATLRGMGITETLAGSLGLIPAALEAGMTVRGDFGLNLTNRSSMDFARRIGLASATASFELSARQIRELSGVMDTEMLIYGRMPVMLTEKCLIRSSAGRCSCATPTSMSDPFGNVFPVAKDFGCRNTVYGAKKVFLADRPEVYINAGLWAVRLLFTTESARECGDVVRRYRGLNRYTPNNTGRGLYVKGAFAQAAPSDAASDRIL